MPEIRNPQSEIPKRLGVGVGFREAFRADIFLHREKIDFLEITADHYLDARASKIEELKLLKDHFPLIPHSLDLSLGSAEGIDEEYLEKIAEIKEFIRRGDTYQTNLTQQLSADLPENLSDRQIFYNLRRNHPAPFAAFLQRNDSCVISVSPERFFRVNGRQISTSPIKGTRPRGKTAPEDLALKNELLTSEKDRAENVMIVDLLRNDLGRICRFGSVRVEKLCDLEEHPTLFHLVSTVSGELRENTKFSDILRAVFPCGSITGAPKISTMRIIDRLETAARGLSMGAIGFSMDSGKRKTENSTDDIFHLPLSAFRYLDLSVAIRTMIIKDRHCIFNVGGGIVIDSDPESEYEETLVKAKALLGSINGKLKV